uniref:Uncharacterized protein n=1 Tax=Anopheles atroparvus TaxID=41427 RepID=A0AAG5DSH8_ANOAO
MAHSRKCEAVLLHRSDTFCCHSMKHHSAMATKLSEILVVDSFNRLNPQHIPL